MNKKMNDNIFIKLYIKAKANLKVKQSIDEVVKATGVDIDYIRNMIYNGELSEEDGKLSINEKDSNTKKEEILNYLKYHPEAYKYELLIALGIDMNFINKMIENGELAEKNGRLTEISAHTDAKRRRTINEGVFLESKNGIRQGNKAIKKDKVIKRENGNGFKRRTSEF